MYDNFVKISVLITKKIIAIKYIQYIYIPNTLILVSDYLLQLPSTTPA